MVPERILAMLSASSSSPTDSYARRLICHLSDIVPSPGNYMPQDDLNEAAGAAADRAFVDASR